MHGLVRANYITSTPYHYFVSYTAPEYMYIHVIIGAPEKIRRPLTFPGAVNGVIAPIQHPCVLPLAFEVSRLHLLRQLPRFLSRKLLARRGV